ncbi:MAG: response regulator [Verrucomicrobia bacterium]|nr:response regulator [Verrucomicrobiota bacterium]MDA1086193.1 response regulator [Verrucomicrobiota bacterium]
MEKTILLVDDEPAILSILSRMLERFGFDTLYTSDGSEALQIMEREEIHVVMVDLRMPGMDGVTLCRELKTQHPAVCVFALSAFVDAYTEAELLEAGFAGWLGKPFDMNAIAAICGRAFSMLESPA